MRKFGGFGISASVIDYLIDKNITKVLFTYMGSDKIYQYKCSLHKFKQSDKTHIFMDNDLQKFVPIRDMEEI